MDGGGSSGVYGGKFLSVLRSDLGCGARDDNDDGDDEHLISIIYIMNIALVWFV